LRRFALRFESIHADMAAELALASSGMTTPFPCAIFLAYNICAGLGGLEPSFPGVSPSAFLGACSLRNLRQIENLNIGENGLIGLEPVLGGIDDISFVHLSRRDIVRHKIVADIVDAYEVAEGRAGSTQ